MSEKSRPKRFLPTVFMAVAHLLAGMFAAAEQSDEFHLGTGCSRALLWFQSGAQWQHKLFLISLNYSLNLFFVCLCHLLFLLLFAPSFLGSF